MDNVSSHFSGLTTPYWSTVKVYSPIGSAIPLTTDVCVVGAGIAGLTTAYYCAKQRLSVCVLDAGPIVGGQTGRTTAHLTYVMDDRFQNLVQHFGEEKTARITESHQVAIDQIETIIRTEKINCDFSRLNGFLFLSPDQTLDFLEKELSACLRIGLQNVELVNEFESSGIGPALRFNHQGQFHPIQYINGLIKALENMNVSIHPFVRIDEVIDGEPCTLKTASGKTIKAASVVVATNTPINDRFVIHTKQAPYRTYVVASQIKKGVLPLALYWDTGDPYHYVRFQNSTDPNFEMIIVGGEDHKTGQEDHPELRFRALENWAKELFPEVEQFNYRWSGQVWEPVDSLAFIGRNPGEKNVYIVTGDSGQGMTYGTIAGLLISDLIQGRENPWEKLYEPSRKPIHSAIEYFRENFNVADQYLEHLKAAPVESISQIELDEGAVIQDGLNKIAVYRDEKGFTRQFSAVCPHLGGIVHWNNVEKTWDCPCHGSRFNTSGEPVNGPAKSCLKPWKQLIEEKEIVKIPDRDISISGF